MSTAIQDHLDALIDRPNDAQLLATLNEAVRATDGGLSGEQLDLIDSYLEELKASRDWFAVIGLIEIELSQLSEDERKARLLSAKAELLYDELFDGPGALAAYRNALDLRPDDEDVQERIEDIEAQQEKWPQLCEKFVNEAEGATDQALATYLFQCAAEVIWRNEPESPRVEELLRRSLDVEPRNGRSAELLERLLRSQFRFDELATLLERRSSVAATQHERVAALLSLGEMWSGQVRDAPVDAAKACEYYKNALALDPKNARALRMLVLLLTQLQRWTDLAHAYEDALRARSAADQDAGTLVQIGQLYATKLDNIERAEEFFRRVQKVEPTQRVMLDFYRGYYRDRGEAAKMLVLLDKAQRSEKDVELRLEIAREWAQVAEHDVGNLDKAIDIWKGILRLSPGNAEATTSLKRLYRETSKWNALRELLKEEIEALPDDQIELKIERLMQVVELYNTHLKLPMMVINTYSAILDLQPDHQGALDALVERYEQMGRWKELIGMLDRRKQHHADPRDRIETLHRIAALWLEKFGNHSQAIDPLEEILSLDPLEHRALEKLKETHQRRRNWRGLLDLIKREAVHRDLESRRELVKEMARVASEKLGDNGEGIEVWNQMLLDDPYDREALVALADLYRREDRWAALCEVLHRQLDRADQSEQLPILEQLGDIYTSKLRGSENAIDVWQKVLALRGDHPKAIALLRELYVQQNRFDDLEQLFAERQQWAQLAETMTAAADRSTDSAIKTFLYTRVGELCSDQLDNAERGIKAYERVLAVDPENVDVARRLVPLYQATERWTRLRGAYEMLLATSSELEEQLELLARIRELCEEQLGSKQLAFEWAARAYERCPERDELGQQLRRLAGQAEAWPELIAVLRRRVEALEEVVPKQILLREIAEICAARMHRPEDAEQYHLLLLDLQADDGQALEQLEQLYSSKQRWDDLVGVLRRQGELADEGSEQHVDRLFKIAYIQEERLADPAAAVETFRQLVAVCPHDLRALKSLERLYHVRGEWEQLVEVLRRQLSLVDEDDAKVELLYALGEILNEELEQRDAAIEELARALSIDPNHRPTARSLEQHLQVRGEHQARVATLLEPVYERSDDHAKLAGVLDVLVDAADPSDQRPLLRRLQGLYDKRLSQPDEARGAALRLFELDVSDEEARRDLARLCEQTSEQELFVRALEEGLERAGDRETLELALRWDLARTLDRQLGRAEDAEEHVRRIVEMQPGHTEAFSLFESILRDKGKWIELREVLQRRRELSDDIDEQRRMLAQICALNEDVLGDDDAAIAAYEEMLQLQPDDEEAVRALERHYRDAELWRELADFYASRLSHAKHDDEINQLKVRQAEVRARELDDVATALDLLEEVAASNPEHDGALSLLELLLTEDAERRRVTELLENVYQRLERWQELVTVLLVRRDLCEDTFEQVQLLMRVATLLEERLDDAQTAFFRYRDALTLAPATGDLQRAVKRLIEKLELWEAGAQAWQAALAAADSEDVPLLAKLLTELATLQDEHLDQAEEAAATYQRLLELDPDAPETGRVAAVALARLHEIAGRYIDLVDVLERQLAWSSDVEERRVLLLRIGAVLEDELRDTDKAIATYLELLQEDERSPDALDALERLYLESERWEDLVGVFRRRVDLADQAEQRVDLWRRIAALYETEIHDREQTIESYLSLLIEHPEDREALRALSRLYQDEQRWPDLLEIVERQLALSEQGSEEYRELLFAAADLQHQKLHDVAPSIDRYRELLDLDVEHARARSALEQLLQHDDYRATACEILAPVYQQGEHWEPLIRVRQMQAEMGTQLEQVAHYTAVGEIYEIQLGERERAFDSYRQAFELAASEPELPELLRVLQRLTEELGAWEATVDAIETVAQDVADVSERQRMHLYAAGAAWRELEDLPRAERHLRQLLELDPDHPQALEQLEQLYVEQHDAESLLEIVLKRAELADDQDAQVVFFCRAAELNRADLERPEHAVALYERVREIDPLHRSALEALDGLYSQLSRHHELSDLLQFRAEQAGDIASSVELYRRLAELCEGQLADRARAIDAYRELLRVDSSHESAIAALENYLEMPELSADAATILEPLYVGRQAWRKLIHLQKVRLDAATEPNERLALMRRIAQLFEEQLEDLDGAFTWYGKVFVEDAASRSTRDQLMRLTGILDCWDRFAELLERFLDETLTEDETTRHIALLAGHIYDDRLYTWEPAKRAFERVLTANPGDEEAFRLLEQLLMRHERWQELLDLYRRSVDSTLDSSQRRDLMFKIARVWEEALEDLDQAIGAYRAIFDEESDLDAAASLDRLLRETERWEDLCELVVRRMEFVDDADELTEMHFALGRVYEEKLLQLPAAVDQYEEVLKRDPYHRSAISALEHLVMDREQRFRIAQILEPIYLDQDEWAKLVVIYDAQLAFIEDKDRRVFLLGEIARLHEERGGSLELAFRALCSAFEEEPHDEEMLQDVERLAADLSAWKDVVQLLCGIAEKSFDFDLQAQLFTRVAQLREDKLSDPNGAVEAWRKVLGVHEDDAGAMSALLQLLELLGRWEELVEVLRRKGETSLDPHDQLVAFQQIAEIYGDQLPDAEKAIEAWRQVLANDPTNGRALDALERLYRGTQSWMDLIWVYQNKLDLTDNPTLWRDLQLQVAETYEQQIADNFEAINAYKALLERDNRDDLVLDSLDRLFSRESLWADLLQIVDLKAALATDEAALNGMRFRAGAILANELGEVEAAIDRFEQVVASDPEHEAARESLEKLLEDEAQRERVAHILEKVFLARRDFVRLTWAMEARLTTVGEPVERRDLLMRVAELKEKDLGDNVGAFDATARAFREYPQDEQVHEQLDRISTLLGNADALVELYEERIDDIYDTDLGRRLHLKIAAFLRDQLEADERAEVHYRAALDLGGEDVEALAALDDVLARQGKHEDLLEVLERRVAAETDPSLQAELLFRGGQIRQEQMLDLDGAFSCYRDAVERDAEHHGALHRLELLLDDELYRVPVLEVLEPIYEQAAEHSKLQRLWRVRISTIGEPEMRAELWERLARLQEDQLADPGEALESYGKAIFEGPDNLDVLAQLERLAEERSAFSRAAEIVEHTLAREVISGHARREIALKLGSWYTNKLDQKELAERRYNTLLDSEPENLEALAALDGIYRSRSDFGALVGVLERRATAEPDAARQCELWAEVAHLKEEALEQPAGAIDAWRAVLDSEPTDRAALTALARLYENQGLWTDLLDVLRQQAEQTDDINEQLDLRRKLARLLEERVEDLQGAIDAHQDILDREPADMEALDALERLQRRREDFDRVEEVLLRRLDVVDVADQVGVYLALAELNAAQLANDSQAVHYLQQILDIDPRQQEAYEQLERKLRQLGQWNDLIELRRRRADLYASEGETGLAVKQLVSIARLWTDELDNPDAAAEVLEEVLEQDRENVYALAELARLYESTQQWERCAEVLERALALNPDAAEEAELEFRKGRVKAEQGADGGEVLAHYNRAVELDNRHIDAARAVLELAQRRDDFDRVAEMLELIAAELDGPPRLAALTELGTLYAKKLGDDQKSVAVWERARELYPDKREVLVPLAEAYCAAERLEDAEPLLVALIEQAGSKRSKELARYHQLLGVVAERRGDADGALGHYEKAYRIDSSSGPTLVSLGNLHIKREDWEAARRIYRQLLLQNPKEDWGITRARIFGQLGKIHAAMGQLPKARSMLERGLEIDPDDDVLRETLSALD